LLCIFQNDDDWDLYVKHGIIKHDQGRFIKGSGVDLNQFSFTPETEDGKLKVMLTARMIVEKGIFLLTEAAERLRKKYEDRVEFLLVGGLDDHPGAITQEQLNQVCDGKYIKWLGYRTDIADLLKECHIMAFPSYYMEGLPKSLIEANAVGRPIITSNSVGCKETVIDGYNGFLIQPRDVNALTEKLDVLLSDKELRVKMGKNARKYAEDYFSIELVKERHLAIYNELISD
jgi:glycosyltransferase involved in cell wall biosynthesis